MTNAVSQLAGEVHRVIFANEETGWCVLVVQDGAEQKHTVVGEILGVLEGEYLDMEGRWVNDKRYGLQFQVEKLLVQLPITPEATARFLSDVVHGIGPQMSKRIVEVFGDKTYEILDTAPERLNEVPRIGKKLVKRITSGWQDHKAYREIVTFLLGHGVGSSGAWKIYQRYGNHAVRVLEVNPWKPARDISGIGFASADKLALSLGVSFDSPTRIEAAIVQVLQEGTKRGHVFLTPKIVYANTVQLTQISDEEAFGSALSSLIDESFVVEDKGAIYLKRQYDNETKAAAWIREKLKEDKRTTAPIEPFIKEFEQKHGYALSKRQREAIELMLTMPFSLLTGGPGTGKSSILDVVVSVLASQDTEVRLCSPTGRAAARMTEVTGLQATTIHQLLGPLKHGFRHNEDNPLEKISVLILDEVSMLDMRLAWCLLQALPPNVQVIMVGDPDQLPSVGAGAVLAQLLATRSVPRVTLDRVFRQGDGSQIALGAAAIREGKLPTFHPTDDPNGDFYFVEEEDPDEIHDITSELVGRLMPKQFRYQPEHDIQVLAPVRKGKLGTEMLNSRLQRDLNTFRLPVVIAGTPFREGDRVMQTKNDYDLGIMNGDVGHIERILQDKGLVLIQFARMKAVIPYASMANVEVCYASTVHKFQGEQMPAVVIIMHPSHYISLKRNVLYTAVTRAQRVVVIVGTKKALHMALNNTSEDHRLTRLADRIDGRC